jgi:hypothetical protein
VLISGDMLLPRISTNISAMSSNPDGDPLGCSSRRSTRFRALPEDTLVLPSHGRPFRGMHARASNSSPPTMPSVAKAAVAACEGTPKHCLRPDRRRCSTAKFSIAHQTMFAMGEAIAHLNYLEHAGRLRASQDATACSVSSPANPRRGPMSAPKGISPHCPIRRKSPGPTPKSPSAPPS